jgi:hypothetical protein
MLLLLDILLLLMRFIAADPRTRLCCVIRQCTSLAAPAATPGVGWA